MRGLAICLLGAVFAPLAQAGPWGQDPGDVYARIAFSNEVQNGLDGQRLDVYGEFGLWKDWTLIAKAERVEFGRANELNAEAQRLTVRKPVLKRGRFALAAEGGLVNGAAISGDRKCQELGVEVGGSIGSSGLVAGRPWYGSVDLAGRQHNRGCQRLKLDIVTGIEYSKDSLVVFQVYNDIGNFTSPSHKAQIDFVQRYRYFDLSFGYKQEFGSAFDQTGFVIALTTRF